MTRKFEIGATYATRSLCDHDCIFRCTVVARTAKTVTVAIEGRPGTVRRGLTVWEGTEQFSPFGRYSMAPIFGADDLETAAAA